MYPKVRKNRIYKEWKKDEYGNYINQDGSLRKCMKSDYRIANLKQKESSSHRAGSLGEDQESVLL